MMDEAIGYSPVSLAEKNAATMNVNGMNDIARTRKHTRTVPRHKESLTKGIVHLHRNGESMRRKAHQRAGYGRRSKNETEQKQRERMSHELERRSMARRTTA